MHGCACRTFAKRIPATILYTIRAPRKLSSPPAEPYPLLFPCLVFNRRETASGTMLAVSPAKCLTAAAGAGGSLFSARLLAFGFLSGLKGLLVDLLRETCELFVGFFLFLQSLFEKGR